MEWLNEIISNITIWKVFGFIFCSGCIVEVVPIIKCNPISATIKWIGKISNKEIIDKIDTLSKSVDLVQDDLQTHKIESWRREILNFSEQLMMGKNKSREQFNYIISLHDNYEKYIDERHLTNGQMDVAYAYITKTYNECLENNSFYTGK